MRTHRLLGALPPPDWWGWRTLWRTILGVAILANLAILLYAFLAGPNPWRDGDAYLNAALRIRAGFPLYPELSNDQAATVYRYAPWFAWMWVPLSYLPRETVVWGWQLAMLACSALAVLPGWQSGSLGRAIVVVVSPFLVMASLWGNVQPAVVAILVYGVGSRAGPLSIALAASLKFVPLLYVVTYLGRRQWRAAFSSVALTALLWAPALIAGVDHYPVGVGSTTGLWSLSPVAWTAITVILALGAFIAARRSHAWYASSVLVAVGTPRFIAYDWTFLLVGAHHEPHDEHSAPEHTTNVFRRLARFLNRTVPHRRYC